MLGSSRARIQGFADPLCLSRRVDASSRFSSQLRGYGWARGSSIVAANSITAGQSRVGLVEKRSTGPSAEVVRKKSCSSRWLRGPACCRTSKLSKLAGECRQMPTTGQRRYTKPLAKCLRAALARITRPRANGGAPVQNSHCRDYCTVEPLRRGELASSKRTGRRLFWA